MKLRIGYLLSGIATGLMLLTSILFSLPDGNLHIVFCSVGQGDAAYIRFPDGRDMLVDGGPNNEVIRCLSNHMPFWDRTLDIVLLTHPQRDHMQGLIEVIRRYEVGTLVKSDVTHDSQGYAELLAAVASRNVPVRLVQQGEKVRIGAAAFGVLWPSDAQIAKAHPQTAQSGAQGAKSVLGASAVGDLNDYSIVFHLRYGTFDAIFTGDADTRVEQEYRGLPLAGDPIEVLKVPHHGSKTGMSEAYLSWLMPKVAVISVGKNNYGHPAPEILAMLRGHAIQTLRTDEAGDIEVVTDGVTWKIILE